MSFFYLASPYSRYSAGRVAAFEDIAAQAALLMEAGVPVFAPIVHTHPIQPYIATENDTHDFWLAQDRHMMRAAKGLIVCKLEGWQDSYGVTYEIQHFRDAGKPVVFMTPGEVPQEVLPKARQVIGLCGFAGSGKDEAAKALVSDGWTRVSFADALRDALYALNPIISQRIFRTHDGNVQNTTRVAQSVNAHKWEGAKADPEVRELLQRMGTEAGRNIHGPDCWVQIARRKIEAAPGNVVLTDCRFQNEIDLLREYGGTLIRIERKGVGPVNGHVSEQLQAEPDHVIANDGTVAELHEKIRTVVSGKEAATC